MRLALAALGLEKLVLARNLGLEEQAPGELVPGRLAPESLAPVDRELESPAPESLVVPEEDQALGSPVRAVAGREPELEPGQERDLARAAQEAVHLRLAFQVLEGAAALLVAKVVRVVQVVEVLAPSLLSLTWWTALRFFILDCILKMCLSYGWTYSTLTVLVRILFENPFTSKQCP